MSETNPPDLNETPIVNKREAESVKVKSFEKSKNSIDISLTSEASQRLSQLVTRPNPTLSEFSFLGLGKEGVVNEIIAMEENSPDSGLFKNGFSGSKVDREEILQLFKKLNASGRQKDLMVFGHVHPTGQRKINGVTYVIAPNDLLLDPSMGSSESGGLATGGDLAFFKSFTELNPQLKLPYIGIVANTQGGSMLRIYELKDLLRMKKYNDIDKLSKITINLNKL